MQRVRPIVVGDAASRDPCAHCDARHRSICGAVGDDDLGRLAAVADVRALEKGVVFVTEGEPADAFFNVASGTVKLFKLLADGRQQVTGFAGVGHFLGLAASDRYAFSAETIEPVRVCRFSRTRLRALMADLPALERRLLETACNELVTAQEQILMLGRKTAQERVASFLVDWGRQSTPCGDTDNVRLPMTRAEIADYLGLTIETVSRTFSRLRAERRIGTPSNREVVLLDYPWLAVAAAGGA